MLQAANETGYIFIPQYLPEESTLIVARRLGTILQFPGIEQIQILRPRLQAEAPPNIYSGNYGYNTFPLHTDLAHWCLPPRYLMLRCVSGVGDVATHLFDGKQLMTTFGEALLKRTLVQPRRPVKHNRPLLRLLDERGGNAFLRWDSLFIQAATSTSAVTCQRIGKYLETVKPLEIVLINPGDTLLINNWHVLHGRSSVSPGGDSRKIERAYIGELK